MGVLFSKIEPSSSLNLPATVDDAVWSFLRKWQRFANRVSSGQSLGGHAIDTLERNAEFFMMVNQFFCEFFG